MIPYLLRVALLIATSFLFFKVWLAKETFYTLNRLVLASCLLLSFALPCISVPQSWLLLNTDRADKLFHAEKVFNNTTTINNSSTISDHSSIYQVSPMQQAMQWGVYLYWAGVAIFTINFLIQLVVLYYYAYSNDVVKDNHIRIVLSNSDKPPCSFANNIFINPSKYDWDTYNQILAHEKVHVRQWHTVDIVLMQAVLVLQWFNPFAWLYRRELENNLEFLTDDCVLTQNNIPKESYQQNLVKVSVPYLSLGITANYNTSLLKKRIVMMNEKKSSLGTLYKYLFIAPLFACLVCAINNPVIGKQTNNRIASNNPKNDTTSAKQTMQSPTVKPQAETIKHSVVKQAVNRPQTPDTLLLNDQMITPDFIKSFENIGYNNIPASTLIAFKSSGVDADFAKSFWFVGYDKIPPQQLLLLKQLNITPDYIKSFWRVNYENEPLDKLIKLKTKNITPDQVAAFENMGFKKSAVDTLLGIQ